MFSWLLGSSKLSSSYQDQNRQLKDRIYFLELENQQLKAENQQLREENQRLRKELKRRDEVIAELREQLRQALERIAVLEEQLKSNSQNSSKPPSADPPSAPKRSKKKSSGKKRGAQQGHKGNFRELIPSEECDKVLEHRPEHCRKCHALLEGDDPDPQRHQECDIPPVEPIVTEHRLHELECQKCGTVTRAKLPEGVSFSGFGPRVVAMVALLSAMSRNSIDKVRELLWLLFNLEISNGSVVNLRREASEAVAEPVEEAGEYVREQAVVNGDETGFRQGDSDGGNPKGRKAWLWVVATPLVAYFHVCLSRGQKVAKQLLGEAFSGIFISDRWNAYNWLSLKFRQLCWSHLKRDFQKIADRSGESGRIGEKLLDCEKRLFQYLKRVRDGTLNREQFAIHAEEIRTGVLSALKDGASYQPEPKEKSQRAMTARTCAQLLKVEPAMWTFVSVPGVEPTNNFGERVLRHGVIWRKITLGSQSRDGSIFVARMLTVLQSLRYQKRDILSYLEKAVQARRKGATPPSLLPGSECEIMDQAA